jgi:hypothetical protein
MAPRKIKLTPFLSLVMTACLATVMSGCKPGEGPKPPPPESTDLASASKTLTDALSTHMKAGTPLTDKAQLANRLRLPADRVDVFDTGIGGNTGDSPPGPVGIIDCQGGTHCFCHGDLECNDMFSGMCRDPKTGGSCTTDSKGGVTCDCFPLAKD